MMKITELPLVKRASALTPGADKPDFLMLPLNYDRIFTLITDYWIEIPASICYDKNGLPHIMVKKSERDDIQMGYSTLEGFTNGNAKDNEDQHPPV